MWKFWSGKKKAVIWMALVTTIILAAGLLQNPSPMALLEAGDIASSSGNCKGAISLYDRVIKKEMISDAGKAEAYWKTAECARELKDTDIEGDALLGFIVHSLIVQDFVSSMPGYELDRHPASHWLRDFNISSKLLFASERLQDIWEDRKNEASSAELSEGSNKDGL